MNSTNPAFTPIKSKLNSNQNNSKNYSSPEANLSGIFNPSSCILIKKIRFSSQFSPDNSPSSSFDDVYVTSTPSTRSKTHQSRKANGLTRTYNIRQENDEKSINIGEYVRNFENNHNDNENRLNAIYMNDLKFKYGQLNTINKDLGNNEPYIYLYPSLFNSEIMTSKFLKPTKLSKLLLVEHRYDGDKYVIKFGNQSKNNILSNSSQRIINEIKVLKLIGNHPNMVDYSDSWIEQEKVYLQLKFVYGGSLHDFLIGNDKPNFTYSQKLEKIKINRLSKLYTRVLLSHITSVLVYLHSELCLSHGDIKSSHILVELSDNNLNYHNNGKIDCHSILRSEQPNNYIKFKLCDMGYYLDQKSNYSRQSYYSQYFPVFDEGILKLENLDMMNDIFSLGLTLYDCLGGTVNHISVHNILNGFISESLEIIPEEWCYIIMNMCHKDPRQRLTAKDIISQEEIQTLILPEARAYFRDNCFDFSLSKLKAKYLEPFNYKDTLKHNRIDSEDENKLMNITEQIKTMKENYHYKEKSLSKIHSSVLKFKQCKLQKITSAIKTEEGIIYKYPILFNSAVKSSKFSTQTLISNTKLSMIYVNDHRLDGEQYIIKVGLESTTNFLSNSSKEIINEMRILKLIGNHPNVVGYCDSWIEQEKFNLQQKFIAGGSLYDFINGNSKQFYTLSDTIRKNQKLYLSSQSAYVLLAHIGSVLKYIHGKLRIFHADIKPSNILVELVGLDRNIDNNESKLNCHSVLASEDQNMNLRFKLCDFGRSGPTANVSSMSVGDGRYLPNISQVYEDIDNHSRATSRDIFSLGLTIYDCFGGSRNLNSLENIRMGNWDEWPESVSEKWRNIIMKLCESNATNRWTASDILNLDIIKPYILPEISSTFQESDEYINLTQPNVEFTEYSTQEDMDVSF